jgi:hypothetical protein
VLATVIVGIAAIVLAAIQTLHRRKVGRDRRSIFAEVEPLLTEATVTQDGIGFPTLRGRWNGHAVKIELVVDTLALRQLPTLWMLATVLRPLPVRTPVDITLRPRSSDIVSAGTSFSYEHEAPRGWPEDLRVTTPEPAIPPLEELDGIVELLELPTTKGVLIAPGGVRVVHELARGSIGQYRVVRRPKFAFVLAADRAIALLLAAEEVADRVEAVGAGLGAVR